MSALTDCLWSTLAVSLLWSWSLNAQEVFVNLEWRLAQIRMVQTRRSLADIFTGEIKFRSSQRAESLRQAYTLLEAELAKRERPLRLSLVSDRLLLQAQRLLARTILRLI